MFFNIISKSPESTKKIGAKLAGIIEPGDLIILTGELGGGKTTFISGLAGGIGIESDISSPSFAIMNLYEHKKIKLVHADFYRLSSVVDLVDIGIDEYLLDENAIVCIEWGGLIKDFSTKDYLEIKFNYDFSVDDGSHKRILSFHSKSKYWEIKISRLEKILKKPDEISRG